jgi:hypothetical protein
MVGFWVAGDGFLLSGSVLYSFGGFSTIVYKKYLVSPPNLLQSQIAK